MKVTITSHVKFVQGLVTISNAPVEGGPAPANNELWAWGINQKGGLGIGNTSGRSSPSQIGGLTNWASVDGGRQHTVAIKNDGTLWSWGYNSGVSVGALGLGDIINRSSPSQVGALTNWASVSAGSDHAIAVKTDGTLWGWGEQSPFGPLGLGDIVDRSSPVQIGSLTDWASVSSGGAHTLAVKTNGTLWSWGANNRGQLGHNDIIYRSSPVQVGGLTTWASVSSGGSFSTALKVDGTVFAWGQNEVYQLGQGNTTFQSSPVAVSSGFAFIGAGANHVHAIKTTGKMYSWGNNNRGQLGDGTVTNRSLPIPIGALTDWASVSGGGQHAIAVKTDETLWAWGDNFWGQLGDGTTVTKYSPAQIGALSNWSSVGTGDFHSLARKTPV